jgi:hypothetical protein
MSFEPCDRAQQSQMTEENGLDDSIVKVEQEYVADGDTSQVENGEETEEHNTTYGTEGDADQEALSKQIFGDESDEDEQPAYASFDSFMW